jgi:hypothetical protein
LAISVLPLAPVEHVHRATDPDGHDHVIAHTHSNAHHPSVHDHDHAPDYDASLDDQDSVILTLDMVLAAPYGHADIGPPVTVVRVLEEPDVARTVVTALVEPLNHGPPSAPSVLRGPPSSSLL